MSSQPPPCRFSDYFVICGLDVSSGLEPDRLSGDNLHCPPLERPYKSKVLAHYPENVQWNLFDKDAVGMLSLPKGLTFRTQKDSRHPRFHTFIITREDGSRTFGATYVFYEEVGNKQICAAMQTLQSMFQAETGPSQHRSSNYPPVPHDSPVFMKKIIPASREKVKTFDMSRDKLYVTKCICLVTQMPYVRVCKMYLKQLHEAVTRPTQPPLPLECYVYNMLYDIPLPPPGRCMKLFGVSGPIFCQRPGLSELPLFDYSLWNLFHKLGMENVLQVFTSILLEHQILLYSSDYHKLMLVAESINALICPFSWQHVYVPILPASLQHFLDAPVPFIMGLHRGQEDRSDLKLPSEANMCFVDIDLCVVEVAEDLPVFPHRTELIEELTPVIQEYQDKLGRETTTTSTKSYPGTPRRDNNKVLSQTAESGTGSWPNSPKKMEILQQSEAWLKISDLAKKTGVWESIEDFAEEGKMATKEKAREDPDPSIMPANEVDELKFNNCIREIFCNRFVHMFMSYEAFVIQPSQDMDSWLNSRETMHNFDKAAFLSDQPEAHLPFLSPFIETQMFTTFIDNKIVSQWESCDASLTLFDDRIKALRESGVETRTDFYSECSTAKDTEASIEKRATYIDHVASKPAMPCSPFEPVKITTGFFPTLNKDVLNTEPVSNKSKVRDNAKWRRKDRILQHAEHLQLNSDQREFALAEKHAKQWLEARLKALRQPKLSDMSAQGMVQTNWKFVETLLKECKTKTKKMLVEKMGQEAVELGHGELSITGVEENTLIASLCDLLERIWSHGLQTKKGKSALWSHLLSFQEIEESNDTNRAIDPKLLTPGPLKRHSLIDISSFLDGSIKILGRSISWSNLSAMALDGEKTHPVKTHRRRSSQGRIELPVLRPLAKSLAHDMRRVQQMTEIKTHVGCARAFVRLALEKKMLSTHLKELLQDTDLLRSLYKRYAFLRCEDEREQFLYHLLSLNAVDFFCFTNTFSQTVVPYRVLIYPSTKFACGTTSAVPWISIAGQLGETGVMDIPKGCLEFSVEHKNLGVLTTLRIGHDNSGMTPRWLVEYVLVRNEISGHTYRFQCGRWLGKGVDDGSIERLLVAELVHQTSEVDDTVTCYTPPRNRSPSSPRKNCDQGLSIPELQENLGHAVNNLVKYFYKPEKERGNLTFLLCGDRGLVQCMEQIFQCGFRSSRLFRNKMFIWDLFEKIKVQFEHALAGGVRRPIAEVAKAGYWLFCNLLNKINAATETIGKDGKFQIFICVGIRDHCLHRWLPLMAQTNMVAQMYEENCFMRDPSLINFLVHILDTLSEFPIVLEASLLRGLDI
ncbi:DENN domain-containing protein 5B-like isoform X2 [Haliotis rufescens]|uniref:DENN domain-containing protein 5B-like isoform X2 n=1 Tax=Haliotis rufescens TaxID=6454 RepID=UPI001EAFDBD4|nr:DENN domain-containing protein 5B-like isoform X2 [Haliotis rufescens]